MLFWIRLSSHIARNRHVTGSMSDEGRKKAVEKVEVTGFCAWKIKFTTHLAPFLTWTVDTIMVDTSCNELVNLQLDIKAFHPAMQ